MYVVSGNDIINAISIILGNTINIVIVGYFTLVTLLLTIFIWITNELTYYVSRELYCVNINTNNKYNNPQKRNV